VGGDIKKMTLDYLYCKRHFNESLKDSEIKEMFAYSEKEGMSEYIPKYKGCDTILAHGTKNERQCGKLPFGIIKFKMDYEQGDNGELYPIMAHRWSKN